MSRMNGRNPMALAVLGSGSGSNFQAILDAIRAGRLDARVVCVLSDVENAFILERARRAGVPAEFVSAAPFRTKLDGEGEARYLAALRRTGAEWIALAGFMRIVKRGLLAAFPQRVLNIHPALLPAFPGMESWKQALDYGAKVAGCTVHFVDEGTDSGPILLQKVVAVREDDTPASLHARIQEQEHAAFPEALQLCAEGRVNVEGRRVRIREAETGAR
jgi:phosphoribosylglycinamide formyltransferase-1